jgi:hypothetical protein
MPWFLVFVLALQLCMGSAWANFSGDQISASSGSHSDGTVQAHCHDDADTPEPLSAHSCCSATHCQFCSAAGMPFQTAAATVLPATPHIGITGTMLLSKVHPPEIRPPI